MRILKSACTALHSYLNISGCKGRILVSMMEARFQLVVMGPHRKTMTNPASNDFHVSRVMKWRRYLEIPITLMLVATQAEVILFGAAISSRPGGEECAGGHAGNFNKVVLSPIRCSLRFDSTNPSTVLRFHVSCAD
uniref:Uncharacterized protein n=1 Tax=Glossina pallidipes TaxID=7398 RepID=A0A1B0AIN3_GLOPL